MRNWDRTSSWTVQPKKKKRRSDPYVGLCDSQMRARAHTTFKIMVLWQDKQSRNTAFIIYRNTDNMEGRRIWSQKPPNAQSTCCHSDSTTSLGESRELTSTTVHRSLCKTYYFKTINENHKRITVSQQKTSRYSWQLTGQQTNSFQFNLIDNLRSFQHLYTSVVTGCKTTAVINE